jgi:hypothetical protein
LVLVVLDAQVLLALECRVLTLFLAQPLQLGEVLVVIATPHKAATGVAVAVVVIHLVEQELLDKVTMVLLEILTVLLMAMVVEEVVKMLLVEQQLHLREALAGQGWHHQLQGHL